MKGKGSGGYVRGVLRKVAILIVTYQVQVIVTLITDTGCRSLLKGSGGFRGVIRKGTILIISYKPI